MDSFLQGRGKYEWADGRVYEGEWSKDEMNGSGVYLWPDGKRYVGEFLNGKKQGSGMMEEKEGTYTGQWVNSLKHGPGKYTYPDGRIVQGIWAEGILRRTIEETPAPRPGVLKDRPVEQKLSLPVEQIRKPIEEKLRTEERKIVDTEADTISRETLKMSMLFKKEAEKKPVVKEAPKKEDDVMGEELIRRLKEYAQHEDSSDDYEADKDDADKDDAECEKEKAAEPTLTQSHSSRPAPSPSSFSLSEGSRLSLLQSLDFPASFSLPSFASPIALHTRESLGAFSYPSLLTEGKAFTEGVKIRAGVLYRGEVNGEGERCGRGVSLQDGEIWEGMWDEDRMHGLGRRIAADGGVYTGYWQDGQPHGFGVFTSSSSFYSGEWIHGQRQGLGVERTNDHVYRGHFSNGCKHGLGRLELPTEGVFEGMMKMNKREGYGTMATMDGTRYAGEWHEDKMEGKGVRMRCDPPSFSITPLPARASVPSLSTSDSDPTLKFRPTASELRPRPPPIESVPSQEKPFYRKGFSSSSSEEDLPMTRLAPPRKTEKLKGGSAKKPGRK